MIGNKLIHQSLTLYLYEQYEFQRETDLISEYLRIIIETINSGNNIKLDFHTFYQITEFPLFPAKKIFETLKDKYCLEINPMKNFIEIFIKLYTSSISDMTEILFNILDFDKDNIVHLEDTKIFFIYFHFKHFDSNTENKLYHLIENFFNESDKMNKEDFIYKTLNKNSDLLTLFYFFIQKYCFYSENVINCFKNFSQFKRDKNPILSKKIDFENLIFTLEAREYILLLLTNKENNNIEEDEEELQELLIFEKDLNILRGGLNKEVQINALEFSNQIQQLRQFEHYENSNLICFINNPFENKNKRVRLHLINKNLFVIEEDLENFPFFKLVKIIYLSSLCSFINELKEKDDYKSFQCKIPKYILEIITLYNNINNKLIIYLYNKSKYDKFLKLIYNNIGNYNNRINDNFDFINDLGEGKFGAVKLGIVKNNSLYPLKKNDRVAIKIVNKEDKNYYGYFEVNQWEKFLSKTLNKLNCPYLIKLYFIYEDISYIYYIYEYIRDYDLKRIILENHNETNFIFEISKQILIGINYLHKYGIIHRDIKPQNILFDKEKQIIKLTDFGLSTILGKYEYCSQTYGSLFFKSPELLNGNYNYKTDIWSYGITLFYIVFKGPPYKNNDKKKLVEIIKNSDYKNDKKNIISSIKNEKYKSIDSILFSFLDEIITGCLNKNPNERLDNDQLYNKFLDFSLSKLNVDYQI